MHLTVRIPRFHRIPIFCRADFTPKGERCGRQSGVRRSVYPSQSGIIHRDVMPENVIYRCQTAAVSSISIVPGTPHIAEQPAV